MISRTTYLAAWVLVFGFLTLHTTHADELALPGLKLTQPQIPAAVEGATRKLNEQMGRNVEPALNAAVHLVQLFGAEVLKDELRDTTLQMLGIESFDKDTPRMIYLEPFARIKHRDNPEKRQAFLEQLETDFHMTAGDPWKPEDFPALSAYFDANQQQLDRLVAIADLPHYYAPILSAETPPSLMGASYTLEYRLPYMAHCLAKRAMRSLATGDFDSATNDLMAAHKLANLLANGSPLDVSLAKAHWADSFAFRSEQSMLRSGLLSADQAKQYLAKLQEMPRLPSDVRAADIGERLTMHREIEMLRDSDEALFAFFDWDPMERQADLAKLRGADIDWKLAFERTNEIQDKIVAALGMTDPKAQLAEIRRLDAAAAQWQKATDTDKTSLYDSLMANREAASRWIGEAVAMGCRPNLWQRVHTDNRGSVRRDFTLVGFALVAYRQEHGAYPKQLSELTPNLLKELPADPHSNEQWGYKQLPNGKVRLISWGANGIPNAGDWRDDDVSLELD
ncbi:hypothetical protein AB1L30_15820 [Bremerella sp. JC817]|uniref:hypothetical protein n=1 Tax=Bremerella sp. JC817 TaxID=3231756 RepID=UPI0034586DC1